MHRLHCSQPQLATEIQRWRDDWFSRDGEVRLLRVRWLLNPEEAVLENVCVREQKGTVLDIRPCSTSELTNVLPVVLIPPLVNAHTHLEFSALAEPLEPALPFQSWIQSLMKWRGSNSATQADSIRSGFTESVESGIGLIGEISTNDDVALLSNQLSPIQRTSCVAFRELIGLGPARVQQQLELAESFLTASPVAGAYRALSPHAPYTVHPDLLEQAVALAIKHQSPLAMHLAETTDELELLVSGTGRFQTFLSSMGLFDPKLFPGGRFVLDLLKVLSSAPKVLAVHGNYFTDEDIAFLSRHQNFTTVYCPRTHHFFGHTAHPFRKLLSAGCRVVLGTDSRASNPDLSIWRELQHVARLAPELSPGLLLAMITTHAAEAMQCETTRFRICQHQQFSPVFLLTENKGKDLSELIRDPSTVPWHPALGQTSNILPPHQEFSGRSHEE
ncbi:MAG: amidohydrolase family protein [Planctomycetaceae bacterium]